jgi:hypothetical protein
MMIGWERESVMEEEDEEGKSVKKGVCEEEGKRDNSWMGSVKRGTGVNRGKEGEGIP